MSNLIFELLMRRQRRLEVERVALCMLCTYIAARRAAAARRIRGHEGEHRSRPRIRRRLSFEAGRRRERCARIRSALHQCRIHWRSCLARMLDARTHARTLEHERRRGPGSVLTSASASASSSASASASVSTSTSASASVAPPPKPQPPKPPPQLPPLAEPPLKPQMPEPPPPPETPPP